MLQQEEICNRIQEKYYIDIETYPLIKKKLQRTEPYKEEMIKKEIEGMLKERIIRKSKSDWAAPVLLVEKPNKGVRFCINYRKLNKVTKKDMYLLPCIDNMLDWLVKKKYYTTMDLAARY